MDLDRRDDQAALLEACTSIMDRATPEVAGEPALAAGLWRALADAGVVGAALPAAHGGGGMGFLAIHDLAEAIGRAGVAVPAVETLVLGALPIARAAQSAVQSAWLPRVATGEIHLTGTVGGMRDEGSPPIRARRSAGGWRLDGSAATIPALPRAEAVAVHARHDDEPLVGLVPTDAPGMRVDEADSVTRLPIGHLYLADVDLPEDHVLARAEAAVRLHSWTARRLRTAAAALQVGACTRMLELTASYVSQREQFGRPIGSFQAVAHRVADADIALRALRLTVLQAAWLLDECREEGACRPTLMAAWWAAEVGHQVAHTAQHLHGGHGMDLSYALPAFYRLSAHARFLPETAPRLLGRLAATLPHAGSARPPRQSNTVE